MPLYKIECQNANYWILAEDWKVAAACGLLLGTDVCVVTDQDAYGKVFENKRFQAGMTQFLRKTGCAYGDFTAERRAEISAAFGTLCQNPVTREPIPLGEKFREIYDAPGKENTV